MSTPTEEQLRQEVEVLKSLLQAVRDQFLGRNTLGIGDVPEEGPLLLSVAPDPPRSGQPVIPEDMTPPLPARTYEILQPNPPTDHTRIRDLESRVAGLESRIEWLSSQVVSITHNNRTDLP